MALYTIYVIIIGEHFQPRTWTKICSLHFQPKDFYNFWSGYRTLREDAVPSIFPFKPAEQAKCRTTHNSNKEQIVTEDASTSELENSFNLLCVRALWPRIIINTGRLICLITWAFLRLELLFGIQFMRIRINYPAIQATFDVCLYPTVLK